MARRVKQLAVVLVVTIALAASGGPLAAGPV